MWQISTIALNCNNIINATHAMDAAGSKKNTITMQLNFQENIDGHQNQFQIKGNNFHMKKHTQVPRRANFFAMLYRVFFLTGPPPKMSKYRKVNLG